MIYIFNRTEELVTILSNDDKQACPYFSAVLTEELNGPVIFEFEIPADHEDAQYIQEDYMVAVKDRDKKWQAFYIKEIEQVHDQSLLLSVFCEHIIIELADGVLEAVDLFQEETYTALYKILDGSRWHVGGYDTVGPYTLQIPYVTRLDALYAFLKTWGLEIAYRIEISEQKIIQRFVDVRVERGTDTGKRFEFNKDLTEIRRTVNTTDLKTALYGLGKEAEDGTIPTIAPVNNHIKYIGDVEARDKYGYYTGVTGNDNVMIPGFDSLDNPIPITTDPLFSYNFDNGYLEASGTTTNNWFFLGDSQTDYNIPVEPSTDYMFSAHVLCSTNTRVQFLVRREADASYVWAYFDHVGSTSWVRYNFIFWSGASENVQFRLDIEEANKVVGFNDLMLEKINANQTEPSEYRPVALTLRRHRFGVFQSNSEDPAEILAETQQALDNVKEPIVQYDAKALDIALLADVPHEAVHLGATVGVIDQDLDLRLKARVIKQKMDLIHDSETEITLGRFLPVYGDILANISDRISNIKFTLPPDVLREGSVIQTTWLEGEINALKNKILGGSGTVTITDTDGILIENADKTEAIRLLGGILAIANSRDATTGLYDWRTFGTGAGFTADLMTTGTMRFERARGGTLAIGAVPTGSTDASGKQIYLDGVLSLYSSDPSEGEIAQLSGDYKGFNKLRIDEVMDAQNIVYQTYTGTPNLDSGGVYIFYYVDPYQGSDDNPGTKESPRATIQSVIDGLPKYLNHIVYIYFIPGYLADESIVIKGFLGGGQIIIKKQTLAVRYIRDWADGSTANTANHWVEVNMTLEDGTLVDADTDVDPARVVTNSASSRTYIGRVSDGASGDPSQLWDGGSNNGEPVYVDIYFAGSWTDVKSVNVWKYYNDGRTYYGTKTEVSEDRTKWYTVFDSEREGTYTETAGGKKHYINKGYLKGIVSCANNTIDITIENMFIDGQTRGTVTGFGFHTKYVIFRDCVFFGDKNYSYVTHSNASSMRLHRCEVNNSSWSGVIASYGGSVEVLDCKGDGFPYGVYAINTGHIAGGGTGLLGSTSATRTYQGGTITGTWTYTAGEYEPQTVTTLTKTWTNTHSDSWAENFNDWKTDSDDVLQGKTDIYGPYRGCWFFGTAISSAVTNKVIKKVRVYVTRANSSGPAGDTPIRIVWHGYATKPSYAPIMGSSNTTTVNLSRGEGKWVDCTAQLGPKFKDGSAYGIGIYTSTDSEYARMTQTAKVEITYEDVV